MLLACACRTYDTIYTDDAGGLCVSPRLPCNGTCVDPSTDRDNCGGCGSVCGPNDLCVDSACQPCPVGQSACGTSGAAFCADLQTNDENCGVCGKPCPHGTSCSQGVCTCPLTTCGADCVDTTSDVSHCGACDVTCSASAPNEIATCVKSQCNVGCASPFADCDGVGSNGCESNLQSSASSCGACGRACIAGACNAGLCAVTGYTTTGLLGPLAVDATSVYWADRNPNGAIESAPLAGGTANPFFPDASVTLLAVDGPLLVWLHLNNQIESRPISGGSATLVASASGIRAIATLAGYVYYTTSAGDVLRVPSDGSSAPTPLTNAQGAQEIAVDATTVYFTTASDILEVPVTGQQVATVFAQNASPVTLALDASHVYWSTTGGAIYRQAKGGTVGTQLASGQSIVTNLATDGVALYWGTQTSQIEKVSVSGGLPFVVSSAQPPSLHTVAVDGTRVYWASDGTVASTTK